MTHFRTLQKGTAGEEIAVMLDDRSYKLIPKFENHDLKHITTDNIEMSKKMYEYKEQELLLVDNDKQKLLESSKLSIKPFFIMILIMWCMLLLFAPKNNFLIAMLTVFSVFMLFFPFIIRSMSLGALEDNKKIVRNGILTDKEKINHSISSPSYHWYLSNRKHIIHRDYDNFNNAEINDFIEISRGRFGNQILEIKKVNFRKLNHFKIEDSDWEIIE